MNVLLRPWVHFADFDGRSRRSEYILFHVTFWVILLGGATYAGIVGSLSRHGPFGTGASMMAGSAAIALTLFFFGAIIPAWAVAIRRIHDMGQSGWMALLFFFPVVNFFFLLALCFIPGTEGENEFGWDPREPEPDDYQRPGSRRSPRDRGIARVTRSEL
ncbi:MAG: DUF805 domain-containing protein [Novosphingobium sp.]|nr:DUF805 domain-containing protein [Novosphingobium sp.]